LSVVTYLLHDDVRGWTDYVNKHYITVYIYARSALNILWQHVAVKQTIWRF